MNAPLGWQIQPTDIPDGGLAIDRTASHDECVAIAAALDIPTCHRLRVHGKATLSTTRITVNLAFDADLTQICVVTLEPVATKASGSLRVTFHRTSLKDEADDFDPMAEDDDETLENGLIPLGRIVYEELACRIDPYPRKPGADFNWQDPAEMNAPTTPFAKLAALKPRKEGS